MQDPQRGTPTGTAPRRATRAATQHGPAKHRRHWHGAQAAGSMQARVRGHVRGRAALGAPREPWPRPAGCGEQRRAGSVRQTQRLHYCRSPGWQCRAIVPVILLASNLHSERASFLCEYL